MNVFSLNLLCRAQAVKEQLFSALRTSATVLCCEFTTLMQANPFILDRTTQYFHAAVESH